MQIGHVSDEHLSALLDEQLMESERQGIDEHLAGCRPCSERLEGLRRTVALVRRVPAAVAPRSFVLADAGVRAPAPLPQTPTPRVVATSRSWTRLSGSSRVTWLRVCSGLAAALMVVLFIGDPPRPAAPSATSAVSSSSDLQRLAPAAPASGVDPQAEGRAAGAIDIVSGPVDARQNLLDGGREAGADAVARQAPAERPASEMGQTGAPPAAAPAPQVSAERSLSGATAEVAITPPAPGAPPAQNFSAPAPGAPAGPASPPQDVALAPPVAPSFQVAPRQDGAAPAPAVIERNLRASSVAEPAPTGPSVAQLTAGVFGIIAIILALASFLVARRVSREP